MSLFEWKDQYSVGYLPIDIQHKRLFQLADELHAAMLAGKGKDVQSRTLHELIVYTKQHFGTEEGLMQKAGYPDYPRHKAEHDKLTKQVVDFQKNFESGAASLTITLLQFLKDWLSHHIGETDQKIAAFLREKAA